MVHARGALGIRRHKAEGGQAAHIPVKQSGGQMNVLSDTGH